MVSEEVDKGCHFYRWPLQRLLPHVAQHSRQGHLSCSVVSEIPFQTHVVAHSWPGGNDLCPLLMQLANPQRAHSRQKTVGSLHILCLECEALGTGHFYCRCPENPQQLPSGCCSCPGVHPWPRGVTTSCLPEVGTKQTLLTPLQPHYSTHKKRCCPWAVQQGCSQAAHPPVPAVSSLISIMVRAQLHHGLSNCSAPESLSFSPSAIESWAFAYLIWGSFSETCLCWNMAVLLSPLIYTVLLWERLAQCCVGLCYFSALLVAVP